MKRLSALVLVGLLSCAPTGPPSVSPTQRSADPVFEPYPGAQWFGPEGDPITEESNVINAFAGPDHCNWESAVMMHVGWPPGHEARDISEARQFFRDPEGVFPQNQLMTSFDADVQLPEDARSTGFRTDFMELWLDPDDETAAYLVFADHVERWPRASDVIACA